MARRDTADDGVRWLTEVGSGRAGGAHPHLALTASLQTLKTLRQVEVINFGDCLVRSKGAIAIADAVRGGLPKLKVARPGLGFPCTRVTPWWGAGGGGMCGGMAGVWSYKSRWAWVPGLVLSHPLHLSELQFIFKMGGGNDLGHSIAVM